ncbi:hypothetical protein BH09MYX1_BH09MYX1_02100 [soil metagenome]
MPIVARVLGGAFAEAGARDGTAAEDPKKVRLALRQLFRRWLAALASFRQDSIPRHALHAIANGRLPSPSIHVRVAR